MEQVTSTEKRFSRPMKGPKKKNEKFKNFIGNRSEGQGFADKRKRKIQYEYMKMLKKEKQKDGKLKQPATRHDPKPETKTRQLHTTDKTFQQTPKTKLSSGHSSKPDICVNNQEGSHAEETHTKSERPDNSHSEERVVKTGSDLPRPGRRPSGKQHKQKSEGTNQRGMNRFSKVAEEHRQRKVKSVLKKQEFLKTKKQQEEAMLSYKKQKQETFKKICKKTHKGQPVMKNQIEYLLQKIEKQVNQR